MYLSQVCLEISLALFFLWGTTVPHKNKQTASERLWIFAFFPLLIIMHFALLPVTVWWTRQGSIMRLFILSPKSIYISWMAELESCKIFFFFLFWTVRTQSIIDWGILIYIRNAATLIFAPRPISEVIILKCKFPINMLGIWPSICYWIDRMKCFPVWGRLQNILWFKVCDELHLIIEN